MEEMKKTSNYYFRSANLMRLLEEIKKEFSEIARCVAFNHLHKLFLISCIEDILDSCKVILKFKWDISLIMQFNYYYYKLSFANIGENSDKFKNYLFI